MVSPAGLVHDSYSHVFWCDRAVSSSVDPPYPLPTPQVSRRLLSKPQDALEGVVLSVSRAAQPPRSWFAG